MTTRHKVTFMFVIYDECDVLLFKTILRFLIPIHACRITVERPVGSSRNGIRKVTLQLVISFFDVSTEFAVIIPVVLLW